MENSSISTERKPAERETLTEEMNETETEGGAGKALSSPAEVRRHDPKKNKHTARTALCTPAEAETPFAKKSAQKNGGMIDRDSTGRATLYHGNARCDRKTKSTEESQGGNCTKSENSSVHFHPESSLTEKAHDQKRKDAECREFGKLPFSMENLLTEMENSRVTAAHTKKTVLAICTAMIGSSGEIEADGLSSDEEEKPHASREDVSDFSGEDPSETEARPVEEARGKRSEMTVHTDHAHCCPGVSVESSVVERSHKQQNDNMTSPTVQEPVSEKLCLSDSASRHSESEHSKSKDSNFSRKKSKLRDYTSPSRDSERNNEDASHSKPSSPLRKRKGVNSLRDSKDGSFHHLSSGVSTNVRKSVGVSKQNLPSSLPSSLRDASSTGESGGSVSQVRGGSASELKRAGGEELPEARESGSVSKVTGGSASERKNGREWREGRESVTFPQVTGGSASEQRNGKEWREGRESATFPQVTGGSASEQRNGREGREGKEGRGRWGEGEDRRGEKRNSSAAAVCGEVDGAKRQMRLRQHMASGTLSSTTTITITIITITIITITIITTITIISTTTITIITSTNTITIITIITSTTTITIITITSTTTITVITIITCTNTITIIITTTITITIIIITITITSITTTITITISTITSTTNTTTITIITITNTITIIITIITSTTTITIITSTNTIIITTTIIITITSTTTITITIITTT
ncbi:hypothetical protein ACOMHN_024142 [Nucella lapillus]